MLSSRVRDESVEWANAAALILQELKIVHASKGRGRWVIYGGNIVASPRLIGMIRGSSCVNII
jgi:hypothetical protein